MPEAELAIRMFYIFIGLVINKAKMRQYRRKPDKQPAIEPMKTLVIVYNSVASICPRTMDKNEQITKPATAMKKPISVFSLSVSSIEKIPKDESATAIKRKMKRTRIHEYKESIILPPKKHAAIPAIIKIIATKTGY